MPKLELEDRFGATIDLLKLKQKILLPDPWLPFSLGFGANKLSSLLSISKYGVRRM